MARCIRLRRGTAPQHETFTGAMGEITVDTTNNTIRVHDGQTLGGTALAKRSEIPDLSGVDYVIAWQTPSAANNYTWYRKYKSGWVEQGGHSTSQTVTLPVEMADTSYVIQLTSTCNSANNNVVVLGYRDLTTTGFTVQGNVVNNKSESAASNNSTKHWYACGFAL